jgi:chromosome partitioning protein
MTPIIAVANHKGGAGKTTTAYHLARHLARSQMVLAVDLDDQGTLTARLAGRQTLRHTVADVLLREESVERAALSVAPNLDLLPADTKLSWAAAKIQAMSPNHMFLARALSQSLGAQDYDLVILDCPPSADIVIVNALMAATHLVMAATPTVESYEGTLRMKVMVSDLADLTGRQPEMLGIVATQVVGNSKSHQRYLAEMGRDLLGCVPLRVGVDAAEQLHEAYGPVAEAISRKVDASC